MEEAFYEKIKIGLLLSKTNTSMSEAEAIESCKIYFKIISSEMINNLLVLELINQTSKAQKQNDTKTKTTNLLNMWLGRLALTKEAYLLIGQVEIKNKLEEAQLNPDFSNNTQIIKELTNNKENPTFKISIRNISPSDGKINYSLKDFAKELAKYEFHKTDMHFPDLEFVILNASKTFFGIKIHTNLNDFEKRKAHLRPILHPTAINPALARAMINLAGAKKEILDPFCGMGGILLEASLIGLNATGIDIAPLMIKRAKLNFQNEACKDKISLHELDALNWKLKAECIVTDLPYGKSSKLNSSITDLIENFLVHYSTLTKKIVLCFPKGTIYAFPKNWKVLYEFEIYIHKSLTRNILVLENTNTL
jgi:putative methyltransferase (TIGR01177 family)